MFRWLRTVPLVLSLAALSFFAASCGSGDQAHVRLVDAISDGPALDVNINTTKAFSDIGFGAFQPATGYTKVSSGTVTVQAYDTGTTTNPILGTNGITASLSSSSQYTLVLAGFLNATGTNAPSVLQITDNNTTPTAGNVEFRIIDASPSSPGTLDVYIVPPGTDITQVNPPTIQGLTYQQASTYQSVAAGTYSVVITASGSKNVSLSNDYALATAGMIRTLVLVDNVGGGLPPGLLELSDLN
jgi:Domain of unknown function (DUF4397)